MNRQRHVADTYILGMSRNQLARKFDGFDEVSETTSQVARLEFKPCTRKTCPTWIPKVSWNRQIANVLAVADRYLSGK